MEKRYPPEVKTPGSNPGGRAIVLFYFYLEFLFKNTDYIQLYSTFVIQKFSICNLCIIIFKHDIDLNIFSQKITQ